MKHLIFCTALFFSFSAFSFEIRSKIEEGALVYGKINKGKTLFLEDKKIIPTPSGFFFFGLPQDSKEITFTLLDETGKKTTQKFSVQKRKWQEEYITGLQPEKVNISNKNQTRINAENQLIKKARENFNTNYFPFCFVRPVQNFKRISSPFGARRILNNIKKAGHSGVDYAAPIGTKIIAPADGIVALVHNNMFLSGKTLVINHGYGLYSSYSHLNKITVSTGDKVKQGDLIAEVGNTGRSTGPHLHYVMILNGVRLDPEQQIRDFPCKK